MRLTTRRIKHKYNSKVMTGFAGTFSDDVKAELEKVRYSSTLTA
jgi:ATP-dependent protease HslVU (ClpYQ) peptidase subunit